MRKTIAILNQKIEIPPELGDYISKAFKLPVAVLPGKSGDEASIVFWEDLVAQAGRKAGVAEMRAVFPQFHFPVKKDVSQSRGYKAATLQGKDPSIFPSAKGLVLVDQDQIELFIHQGLAGKIPVISVGNPNDFEAIIQALAHKNEPQAIPLSMGAILINGLTNWKRIATLKGVWENSSKNLPWPLHFRKNIAPNKTWFQDKVIILSKKPYSGVTHQQLGISEREWLDYSFTIRLHHECAHDYTQRYLGGMNIHLHDEVLADYMGLVQTVGHFSVEWFLAFFGVEGEGYRPGGRMENYLPSALNSPQNQEVMSRIIQAVGENLLHYNRFLIETSRSNELTFQLLSIASNSLEVLASDRGGALLKNSHIALAGASVFHE